MTLNMKVPASQNKKTKTDAEQKIQFEVAHSSVLRVTEEDHEIENIDPADLESNYITNGSYAQGIPT